MAKRDGEVEDDVDVVGDVDVILHKHSFTY